MALSYQFIEKTFLSLSIVGHHQNAARPKNSVSGGCRICPVFPPENTMLPYLPHSKPMPAETFPKLCRFGCGLLDQKSPYDTESQMPLPDSAVESPTAYRRIFPRVHTAFHPESYNTELSPRHPVHFWHFASRPHKNSPCTGHAKVPQ